jgi:hypothetical protein
VLASILDNDISIDPEMPTTDTLARGTAASYAT